MNNRQLTIRSATALVLATVLGTTAANAAEVWLQAESFQKTIAYATTDGVPARSIAVSNASFEDPACPTGCNTGAEGSWTPSAAGWTVTNYASN